MNNNYQNIRHKRLYVIAGVSLIIGWIVAGMFQKKQMPETVSQKILGALTHQQDRMKKKRRTFDEKFKERREAHKKRSREFEAYFKEAEADLNRNFELAEEHSKRREQKFDEEFARRQEEHRQRFINFIKEWNSPSLLMKRAKKAEKPNKEQEKDKK